MKKQFYAIILLVFFAACEKNEEKPTACFTYEHSYTSASSPIPYNDSVVFTNCSENATSYLWDFGDGTTSTETNPIKIYETSLPRIVTLTAFNGSNSDALSDTILDWAIVYKPNIYIYPEKTMDLCLSLNFPKGGKVVSSLPEYNNEWCVTVEPSGLIDGKYDFLFYESTQPDIWQKEHGWVIESQNLESFFKENMANYGFNENEIADFIEYWIPLLIHNPFYAIYPQTLTIIDKVIELNFSVQPKNVNRLFYVVEGVNEKTGLKEPQIRPFNKTAFYVNEWGVVL